MSATKIPHKLRRPLFEQQQKIQLHYLGWTQPILHTATEHLLQQYSRGVNWDLDRCLVVLPGALAGRRLTQLLALRAQEQGLVLRPPEVLTMGQLPEYLYTARLPFASDLEQTLAWTKVLRNAEPDFVRPLLLELPDPQELRPWIDLAKMLSGLHRELASDLVDFADVADEIKEPQEVVRWKILAKLQRDYLDELHTAGLWDVQSARRFAIDNNEVATDREILLIGAVDLNRAQRRFLGAISDSVHVLVGAPVNYSGGFHVDGTLIPEYWQDLEIRVEPSRIHVRSTPTEAAKELAIQLSELQDAYSVQQVTIGIPDPEVVPILQESLAANNVQLRYGPGTPVTQSPPMRLIEMLIDYVSGGSIESFNQLVRVPSIQRWLALQSSIVELDKDVNVRPEKLLSCLDAYQQSTLIRTTNQVEWPTAKGREIFLATLSAIDQWLSPLRVSKQTLGQWSHPIRQVILAIYENEEVHTDEALGNLYARSSAAVNAVIETLQSVPSSLDIPVSLADAYTWLVGQLDSVQVPPIVQDDAIEMLGWLDLALDDAPVLMLTGMHDGVVPESVNGDTFLPNQLRSMLGLMDNARRFARDCYAMLTMLNTREQVQIILNHLSSTGDPQTPSRLLLAVPPDELAARVKWLLEPKGIRDVDEVPSIWAPREGQTSIPIPYPVVTKPVRDMAVTDFKKYEQCPYRFYLGRVERLRAFEHEKLELDGGGFGDLVHKCLEFMEDPAVATSTNPEVISAFLIEKLKLLARTQFGVQPPPALQIQLEQAERRLQSFANHQAAHAEQGWRIKKIEFKVEKTDGLKLDLGDGKSMVIHGRIDRIDYNPKLGTHAVWDYKTGDQTAKPRENHLRQNKTWIDWQLPLYGKLIQSLKIEDLSKVQFGYILLPRNPLETQFIKADFTEAEHAAAIESAKGIALRVYDNQFWPPRYKGIYSQDEYNAITQFPVARRWDRDAAQKEAEQTKLREAASNIHPLPELDAPAATDSNGSVTQTNANGHADEVLDSRSLPPMLRMEKPNKIHLEEHLAVGKPNSDWFSSKMILASAGTGKTYNLATRALRLLFTDQPLDSILATTFTRKAAGEILHRVLSWLANAIEEDASFDSLVSILAPLKITRDTVKYQLGRLCSHLHRFRVSTLDSFYSQLARSFALELKLPPGWSLSDPFQYEQLKQEAISRMFEHMDRGSLKSLVSQLSKGEATRSIRREIENVVSNGYDLFRRTNEEAWNQLTVPKGPRDEEVQRSLHVFAHSTVEHKGYAKSRDAAVEKFNAQEWGEFLSLTLVQRSDDDVPTYSSKELDSEAASALRILAKKAATEELSSRRAQNEAAFRLLQNYHTQLQSVKIKHRTVTFDDIAERLANWLRQTVEEHRVQSTKEPQRDTMDSISHRLDCPVHHLLLDEFQDTSPVQWEIVKPFAEAIIQNQVDKTSFFCVGDSKQAIYGWRGGVAEIFESVGAQIKNVQQEKLVKSFRSSPIVIDFVNSVFSQLDKHECYYNGDEADVDAGDSKAIVEWTTKHFTQHETSKGILPGYVEFRNADVDKSRDPEGDESAYGLFDEVADRIADLHRTNSSVEIGVLCRTNRDVGQLITLLRERGVEASQEGGNPLTDSAAVLLLLSVMRVANHPSDSLAHFHVAHSPLAENLRPEALENADKLSMDLRTSIDALGFGSTLGQLAKHLAPACNERDQDRLKQLVQLGYRYDAMRGDSIFSFIEFVEQQKVALPGVSRVRVMTIHQSKGLEFDAVFLPTLDQTIISRPPSFVAMYEDRTKPPIGVVRYMNRDVQKFLDDSWKIAFREFANQQLAEALCVFYVALTRARQALYLYTAPSSSSKKRWGSVLHSIFATKEQRDTRGLLIHSWGDPKWFESVVRDEVEQKDAVSVASQDRIRRAIQLQRGSSSPRLLPWLRPSNVATATTIRLGTRWTAGDTSASIVGKLVHRWFEEVRGWIEDYKPNKKRLKEIAASSLTQEEMSHVKVTEWVDRFVRFCEMPSVLKALSADRYRSWHQPRMLHLEITNERRLLQVIDGQMLRGVIDRCVLGFDGDRVVRAEILDFKTDKRPEGMDLTEWVDSRVELHRPQLECYRRVLSEQFGLHRRDIHLTLLLLSEDKEVTLDEELLLSDKR